MKKLLLLALLAVNSCQLEPSFARWKSEYGNTDLNTQLYFKNLKREWDSVDGSHHITPCCDVSDCHKVEYDIHGTHYVVKIDGKWVQVPDYISQGVHSDRPNPTGSAIACYVNADDWEGTGVESQGQYTFFCFVPGAGT